jgi:hypothetical protein
MSRPARAIGGASANGRREPLPPAAAPQTEVAARRPSPRTGAVGRLRHRVLRTLRRNAVRAGGEPAVRAAAARSRRLRQRQRLRVSSTRRERERRNDEGECLHAIYRSFSRSFSLAFPPSSPCMKYEAKLLKQSHFRQMMGSTLLRACCAISATVKYAATSSFGSSDTPCVSRNAMAISFLMAKLSP